MKIFVTGVNGFIGTHFLEYAANRADWEITGFDIASDNLKPFENMKNFCFKQGDIFKEDAWLEEQIANCDTLLPLAGVAKPKMYIERPVWTFSLDFEQNLKCIRWCAKHGKRVIFPSTSEVYGMCTDKEFKEDESPLITGPIKKSRWIYSCSKQMMDRVIFGYGQECGLNFSLFRPFNWMGPRLDTFADAENHNARAITQMIYDILYRGKVSLVAGGEQRRSFTWVGDAIEGLAKIVENENDKANGEIFNIGNPYNNYSIKEMAEMTIEVLKEFPQYKDRAEAATLEIIPAEKYYGKAYDDMQDRRPSVEKMESFFGWKPTTGMKDMLRKTVEWYSENGAK